VTFVEFMEFGCKDYVVLLLVISNRKTLSLINEKK